MIRVELRDARLEPLVHLAERCELLASKAFTNSFVAVKAIALIAGMGAGADNIDDMDRLRRHVMRYLFTGVRAPSTFGGFLRSFIDGHIK
ncbi:hypothetical protein OG588_13830 [Streptomyces prunicolor]|uniref:hypothetical protein n=1 Tax=Streptomyces prunicolor TaxID=67348 RepID=UPI00386F8871|nr:hypothetical protein OG588_13830 [Streptomyces prunicolor]